MEIRTFSRIFSTVGTDMLAFWTEDLGPELLLAGLSAPTGLSKFWNSFWPFAVQTTFLNNYEIKSSYSRVDDIFWWNAVKNTSTIALLCYEGRAVSWSAGRRRWRVRLRPAWRTCGTVGQVDSHSPKSVLWASKGDHKAWRTCGSRVGSHLLGNVEQPLNIILVAGDPWCTCSGACASDTRRPKSPGPAYPPGGRNR